MSWGGCSAVCHKLSTLAQHICSLCSPWRFWKIQSMMEVSPICLLDGLPYRWVGTANVQTLNKYLQSWGLERDGNCLAPPQSGQWNQTAHGRRCFSIQQIKERICFDFPGQNFPSPMLLHNMLHWAQRVSARMLYGHITINFLIILNFNFILFF